MEKSGFGVQCAIAKLGGSRYYNLPGNLEEMVKVMRESVVDGFELQLLPEWDGENLPLTDAQYAGWGEIPKYTSENVLTMLEGRGLPVLSVHANRDIGCYLCSERGRDLEKGRRLISESLSLASDLGARVAVFHLWDTWKTDFETERLESVFSEVTAQHSRAKASVENIPTHLEGYTPAALVSGFDYITLDLRWASMYDELEAFEPLIDKVVNVHLRGKLVEDMWALERSAFSFHEALDRITNEWRYPGLLTVEPEEKMDSSSFKNFVKAMASVRT